LLISDAEINLADNINFLQECMAVNPYILHSIYDKPRKYGFADVTHIPDSIVNAYFKKEELNSNNIFIKKVISSHGVVLQYASDQLKGDRNVVLKAVNQNGLALKYAAAELKDDDEIIKVALEQNANAVQYVGPDKQTHILEFLKKQQSFQLIRGQFDNNSPLHRLPVGVPEIISQFVTQTVTNSYNTAPFSLNSGTIKKLQKYFINKELL